MEKFSALRPNLGRNNPKFAHARLKKLGKKTGILDRGGGEKNRVCGQNIDQCIFLIITTKLDYKEKILN